jgi:hypothetical protein
MSSTMLPMTHDAFVWSDERGSMSESDIGIGLQQLNELIDIQWVTCSYAETQEEFHRRFAVLHEMINGNYFDVKYLHWSPSVEDMLGYPVMIDDKSAKEDGCKWKIASDCIINPNVLPSASAPSPSVGDEVGEPFDFDRYNGIIK